MSQSKIFLALSLSLVLLGGCMGGGTTDPSKGGFFSYNPEAYEKRIQEREARLAAIEAQQAKEREENTALQQAVGEKTLSVSEQQAKLRSMQSNVSSLQSKLNSAKKEDAVKAQELQARLNNLKARMNTNIDNKSVDERKAYLSKLQSEYNSLQQDMDALLLE